MRAALAFLALTASACASAGSADRCAGQDYIELSGRVIDRADLLSRDEEERLTGTLAAFESRTGHQMVVATVDTLQGRVIADYSRCLGNHWGIGRKEYNDGLMLIVAPRERQVRIEVGSGLGNALTEAEAMSIIDRWSLPDFRQARFARGILKTANAMIEEAQ